MKRPSVGTRVLVAASSVLITGSGCQLIAGYGDSLDDGPSGASVTESGGGDATVPDAGPGEGGLDDRVDGECLRPTSSVFGCSAVEIVMLQEPQIVDGLPDPEFCKLTPVIFTASNGAAQVGTPEGNDATVYLRLAWTAAALHLHAHVEEAEVRSQPHDGFAWYGDALEIMLTATASNLQGIYPSPDPGVRFVVAAPGPDGTALCEVAASSGDTATTCDEVPTYLSVASVDVDGGFDVEAMVAWPPFGDGGTMLMRNSSILLDVSFDRRALAADGGRAFQSSFFFEDAGPTAHICASHTYEPYCDDRSWCQTSLNPP